MEQFPLKEIQKIAERYLHIEQMRKYPHQDRNDCHPPWRLWGATKCPLHLPPLAHSKLPGLSQKELEHTSAPQFCTCCPRDALLDLQALTANGVCIQEFHRTIAKQNAILQVQDHPSPAIHLGPSRRKQAKTLISPFLPGRRLTIYFPSYLVRI